MAQPVRHDSSRGALFTHSARHLRHGARLQGEAITPLVNDCPATFSVQPQQQVKDLRKLIAGTSHLPIENLSLVFRGNVLHDSTSGDDSSVQFRGRETVIVANKPKLPAKHIRDSVDDDDGEDLKFQLPESASRWKRRLFFVLRDKFKLPDMLLMAIFSLRLKIWAVIVLWFILAPVAHRYDIGPLYIIGTGFLIIFYNLGHRQPGDVSAYSVFNEDFRELPGTLNADRLDRDIRNGQL
ncbi:hypothetical protein BUALT_Bualt10G0016100 [Buddleja alternifolia]|uniref:Ubiquitin-like domain-containing protein n=1 Tax=Buddleja alternifolia TaxID=168488 RepID=A0AAV6WW24_9LAMI|nr:hypothetical protein BUALT_Bualt10G0016100 [Buddleja alternifolia]